MIVAIVGSRTFHDYAQFQLKMNEFRMEHILTQIVSGGAIGADKLAERYAAENDIPIQVLKPNWSRGKGAGLARNTDIINAAEIVVTFWDGVSRGTLDSITKAKKQNKTVFVGWK